MKPKGNFRVLLMCKDCEKVYNGTKMMEYGEAMRWYHNTMVCCNDTCKEKIGETEDVCGEALVPFIQDMSKPPEEKK